MLGTIKKKMHMIYEYLTFPIPFFATHSHYSFLQRLYVPISTFLFFVVAETLDSESHNMTFYSKIQEGLWLWLYLVNGVTTPLCYFKLRH